MPRKWRKAKPPERIRAAGPAIKAFRLGAGSTVAIEAAKSETELPTFEGCLYTGAAMMLGGFWDPVIIDLEGVKTKAQKRPVLRQHDPNIIVGHTTSIRADKTGIYVAGKFSGEKHHVDSVVVPAKNEFEWEMSIGCDPHKTERLEAGKEAKINGRTVTGPMLIVRETEVGEASFVPIGADGDTSAKVAASKGTVFMWKTTLKAFVADQIAAKKKASYTEAEIDEMDEAGAKCALKKAMKAADDEEEEDKKKKDAAARPPVQATDPQQFMAAHRATMAQETIRQSAIIQACLKNGVVMLEVEEDGKKKTVNLAAHAIENGWDADRVVMQAQLFKVTQERDAATKNVGVAGGLGYSPGSPEINERVIESAILQAARGEFRLDDDDFYFSNEGGQRYRRVPKYLQEEIQRDLKASYDDKTQQHAHTAFKGRMGLHQVLVTAARLNGYRGSDNFNEGTGPEILRFAAGPKYGGIRADGASTASIANILSNVQNKFIGQGYLFGEQAFREVSMTRPVKDFKPTKTVSLLGDTMFRQVPPDGEIDHASISDQAFSNQADQYARILRINRKNLINDDLSILSTAPMKLGHGAILALNDYFWTIFLGLATALADDGNTFWLNSTGTHGTAPAFQKTAGANLQTGAGTALSSASLQAAKLLFDKQVDPNGFPLGFDGLVPILLFPPELWLTAIELVDPSAIGLVYGGSTASKQPNINLWKGRLKPVMSRYLSNSSYTGYSTTAFYIMFAPIALAVMEVCYLNGVEQPTVQMASQDFEFDNLGMSMRGVFDFGANSQNFRGGVKSAGA